MEPKEENALFEKFNKEAPMIFKLHWYNRGRRDALYELDVLLNKAYHLKEFRKRDYKLVLKMMKSIGTVGEID